MSSNRLWAGSGARPSLLPLWASAVLASALAAGCAGTQEFVNEGTDYETCMNFRETTVVRAVRRNADDEEGGEESEAREIVRQQKELLGFNEKCSRFSTMALVARSLKDDQAGKIAATALLIMLAEEDEETRRLIEGALQSTGQSRERLAGRFGLSVGEDGARGNLHPAKRTDQIKCVERSDGEFACQLAP
ncbi:MAG: hypothetical protein EOM26_03595 [Alphaproteobacteria bacterium]|nr:hypothetical protein [Alphaproteobacteria bacterium]